MGKIWKWEKFMETLQFINAKFLCEYYGNYNIL